MPTFTKPITARQLLTALRQLKKNELDLPLQFALFDDHHNRRASVIVNASEKDAHISIVASKRSSTDDVPVKRLPV